MSALPTWAGHLPNPLRYAIVGAGVIAAVMLWRGALLAIPALVVWVLVESSTPGVDLLRVGASFLLAMVGGAGGGFVYGLIRPLVVVVVLSLMLGTFLMTSLFPEPDS